MAAKRGGLTHVLWSAANERDYEKLPALVKDGLSVHFVSRLDEVLTAAGLLGELPPPRLKRKSE